VLDPVVSPRPEAKPRTEPAPEPRPEPLQESAPDVSQIEPLAVPEEVAAPEPLAQVADAEQPLLVPDSEEAKPQDAPRVAPVPAETPEPDAEVAEMPTPSVSPDAAPDAPVVQEDRPEAAPEAATTQIITEAVETTDKPALAPTSSARPRSKPPARTAETPEAEAPAAEAEVPATAGAEAEAPPVPEEDSIADAVAALGIFITFLVFFSLISHIISRNLMVLISHISICKELGPYRLCHGARGAHCSLNSLAGATCKLSNGGRFVQPFKKLQRPVKHLLTIQLIILLILPDHTTLGQRPDVETPLIAHVRIF
jgi:hypothetical protein